MLSGGDVVEMTFDGTLQGDLDTIVVNFLAGTPTFNGVAPALGAVSGFLSVSDVIDSGLIPGDPVVVPATVSISGGALDFVYYNDHDEDGFFLQIEQGNQMHFHHRLQGADFNPICRRNL